MEEIDVTQVEAVVLAAGDFPTHPLPARLLNHPHVVCCDSAAEAFLASGRTPWKTIGDGDSLNENLKHKLKFIQITEQDTNDLSKAIRLLREEGVCHVAIIGATGRREDHTLGNISLLIEYMRQGMDVKMYTDYGVFQPASGTQTFHARIGQQVSIFNFTCKHMDNDGLQYLFPPLTNWWTGTLNQALGSYFTIRAEGEYLIFWEY